MEDLTKLNTDGSRTYFFRNDMGDADRRVYSVFPGVEVIYDTVHTEKFCFHTHEEHRLIELHYCLEGRMEHESGEGFSYLMPGDLSVEVRELAPVMCEFPLRHYHGITIILSLHKLTPALLDILKETEIHLEEAMQHLCGNHRCYILRNDSRVERVFREINDIPQNKKIGYLKIKLIELLYLLNWFDPSDNKIITTELSKTQVQLAKNAAAYLAENIDERVTIEEIACLFNVSESYLRCIFKGVYGVPVYTYTRVLKMQKAALHLIHNDLSIIEIAGECGYDNPSKFSAAFKKVMGENPTEYRKAHGEVR